MGSVFKAVKKVVGGVVGAVGDVVGGVLGMPDTPNINMPQVPTMLSEGGTGDAEAANKAAKEAAAKKSEEEKRKRAAFGRKGTFAGAQSGLIGPAPTGKKKLLGQ